MKKVLLLIAVWFTFWLSSYSQEVQFPPAVLSSGGGNSSSKAMNLTQWRIGEVHTFTLPSDAGPLKQAGVVTTFLSDEWSVSLYPNPVIDRLNIRFMTDHSGKYAIEITDITGRKVITEKAKLVFPGQEIVLDLSKLTPALYLMSIIPSEKNDPKLFKITKE